MEVSATAKYLPVSARKVRLVLDQLPGKSVGDAMVMLRYLPTPHARLVEKVVRSAAANAENNYQMDPSTLKIVRVEVGQGVTLRRFTPRARGQAGPRFRRHSHLTIVVDEETR
jgi:large subunit ribosomal protein L22